MENFLNLLEPLQFTNLSLYLGIIVASIVWAYYLRKDFLLGLVITLYGLHGMAFILYTLLDGLSPEAINIWSYALRLHANITIVVGLVAMLINIYYDRRIKNGKS